MAAASPPTGVSSGELVRWRFEVLNTRNVEPLRHVWTNKTVERFPSGTVHGADAMADYFRTLFAALPDLHMEVVAIGETGDDVFDQMQFARQIGLLPPDGSAADRATKAAFNAKTRLLARVRGRRRR